ncbi:MAG: hypothetical protein ACLRS8_04355 [Parabacteroides merdae]
MAVAFWSKNGVWIEDGYITFDFYIQRGYNDNVKHFLNSGTDKQCRSV